MLWNEYCNLNKQKGIHRTQCLSEKVGNKKWETKIFQYKQHNENVQTFRLDVASILLSVLNESSDYKIKQNEY